MNVSCEKEIKNNRFRVGMTLNNARAYSLHGHFIFVEKDAGEGIGFPYASAGAIELSST